MGFVGSLLYDLGRERKIERVKVWVREKFQLWRYWDTHWVCGVKNDNFTQPVMIQNVTGNISEKNKERKHVTPADPVAIFVNNGECGGVSKPRHTYFRSSVGHVQKIKTKWGSYKGMSERKMMRVSKQCTMQWNIVLIPQIWDDNWNLIVHGMESTRVLSSELLESQILTMQSVHSPVAVPVVLLLFWKEHRWRWRAWCWRLWHYQWNNPWSLQQFVVRKIWYIWWGF